MAVSSEYKAFVAEIFEPLGPVDIKHMFGGAGVYYRDVMFGLIFNETIYLKADAINQEMFEEADAERFRFKPHSGKTQVRKLPCRFGNCPKNCSTTRRAGQLVARFRGCAYRAKAGKSKKA